MKHPASPQFWDCFHALPDRIQKLARRNYQFLEQDPRHPSLQFKRIGRYHSVRVGIQYRALGVEIPEGILWFWIGSHAEYDKLLG